ncbi:hypothetical protein DFH09DRAFT_1434722 [Mycena vulgaris]|nr:hypothetical protein DFH09DRAFT_1434722 [Mycena vulgaris]
MLSFPFAFLALSLISIVNAIPPSNGYFRILDFQGRSVDLHNRRGADFNPIQSHNMTIGEGAQKWLLIPTGVNQFYISNAISGSFASYTTASIGGDPDRCQVCAHSSITRWSITPNGAGYKIAEANSGLVMTPCPFQPILGLTTSPLTLEDFEPTQIRQVFTLQTCQVSSFSRSSII